MLMTQAAIFLIIGIVIVIFSYFIPCRARKKNILLPVRSMKYRRSPPPRIHKWFYEIHLQNIMKTTETYSVKILLKPAAIEPESKGKKAEKLLQPFPPGFEEKPIVDIDAQGYLKGEFYVKEDTAHEKGLLIDSKENPLPATAGSIHLIVHVTGPAFQIHPAESNIILELEPASVEFLVTPSKSGKHLLAVEFKDDSGVRGYLKTYIRVKDYIFLKFISLTEAQVNIIRSIGSLIGLTGIVVEALHTLGLL